jgi:hypothetical protein
VLHLGQRRGNTGITFHVLELSASMALRGLGVLRSRFRDDVPLIGFQGRIAQNGRLRISARFSKQTDLLFPDTSRVVELALGRTILKRSDPPSSILRFELIRGAPVTNPLPKLDACRNALAKLMA